MTPEQMIAAAVATGSPAVEALVRGHLAAGRPGMATLALGLPPAAVSALDEAFADAQGKAFSAVCAAFMAARGLD